MSGMYGNRIKIKVQDETKKTINDVGIVIDASGSMQHLRGKVEQVVDRLVADLAQRSKELGDETRITIYLFNEVIHVIEYAVDVTRLPTLVGRYSPNWQTALVSATIQTITDLKKIPELYGNHAVLMFVITDGYENASPMEDKEELPGIMAGLPDNWTVACLVPNITGMSEAKRFGFPAGNIAIWDTTSQAGMEQAMRTVSAATTSYMTSRSQSGGTFRGTKSLFQVDDSKMTMDEALKAGAVLLDQSEYVLIPVIRQCSIKEMVEECTTNYKIGQAYYQLNNSGTPKGKKGIIVQGNKDIKVMENATKRVAGGKVIRKVAGLPDHDMTVDPKGMGKDNVVFVQSTSLNRILYPGTKLLLLTGK